MHNLCNVIYLQFAASALGATVVGEQPSVMEICLIMLNNQGNFIPDTKNFDFSVCVSMNDFSPHILTVFIILFHTTEQKI